MYEDGSIRVTGIPTRHISGYPTFAYGIELLLEQKRILFTGDMRADLADLPREASAQHWNCIVSEMTHYRIEACTDILAACDTDLMIFNHKIGYNINAYPSVRDRFPFETVIASDGDRFTL